MAEAVTFRWYLKGESYRSGVSEFGGARLADFASHSLLERHCLARSSILDSSSLARPRDRMGTTLEHGIFVGSQANF